MQPQFLYSIGHGHKSFEELIQELLSFDISFLIDVRSNPFSKWASHFNRGVIENQLKGFPIKYAYWGDIIGGKPLDESCYDNDGFFDYHKMALMPQFITGLRRLIAAHEQHLKVAVMCSESNPSECHRSKLIGRELYFDADISMAHIIAPNKIRTQVEIMTELDQGKGNWPNGDIFNPFPDPPYFKSRKPYKHTEIIEEFYPYD